MKQLLVLFTLLVGFALIGCGSTSGNSSAPPASSASIGVRVQTQSGSYTNVTPAELDAMLKHKDFFFANVHIPYEGEIAQTDAFIPYDALDENLGKFPSDRNAKIVLYCRSDRMSTIASEELVKKGYTDIWNLKGGMVAWETAGLPVITKQQ